MKHSVYGVCAALFVAASANAQRFNIDLGVVSVPSSPANTYGAAPPQTGFWNAYLPLSSDPLMLTDAFGQATGASVTLTFQNLAGDGNGTNPLIMGDDAGLLEDYILCQSAVFDFSGLSDGDYSVYTYAWSPDVPARQTQVDVLDSDSGPQIVGGVDWPGMHAQGVTYALHQVSVSGGTLTIAAVNVGVNVGTLNGFQLVPDGLVNDCNGNGVDDATDLADGTSDDADGNGVPDECDGPATKYCVGAANSFSPDGASLFVRGSVVVADNTFTLETYRVPNTTGLYLYGTTRVQVPFGDGFRCAGGQVQRIQPPVQALGNLSSRQVDLSAEPHASQIQPGQTFAFQLWYRDPQAGGSGFNLSDAAEVDFE